MANRKQTAEDRLARLSEGRCPIHGIWMSQVDSWYERVGGALDGAEVTVVQCPRKDCGIQAYAASIKGPWELLPEFAHLLSGDQQ